MEATKKRRSTDMGLLKRLPLEIHKIIYEHALPQRILRVYEDKEERHIVLKSLAAPNLALVCREMLYFCLKKYSRVTYDPVWYPIWPLTPDTRGGMEPQTTWYFPSKDVLFIDHPVHMPRLGLMQDSTIDDKADTGTQSYNVTNWDDASCWQSRLFPMLIALTPIFQLTETVLITPTSGDTPKLAMCQTLFPKLKKILFAAKSEVMRDQFALRRQRATFTQVNCIKSRKNNGRKINCVPLAQSRAVYNFLHEMTKVSDSLALNIWNTICLPFLPDMFREGLWQPIPSHRELVERQMAVARHYWDTAYTIEQDGSRLYDRYGCWVRSIDPNSPELIALLPLLAYLPEIVPVLLYSAPEGGYHL
ncbi:hypothetical protein PG984_009051 [Apiospora sp. TS-2023a]